MIPKNPLGLAILCSLACLCHAAASAANEVATFALRGTVVDEKGAPVPHVKIVTAASPDVDRTMVTDAAGNFSLDVPTWRIQVNLWAKDDAGQRIGALHYVPGKTRPAARIVLHAARAIPVTVVDRTGHPVAGATVGVVFAPPQMGVMFYDRTRQNLMRERTDAKGQAVLHLPTEIPLESVWAAKAGAGFDYVLYRTPLVPRRQAKPLPPDPAKRVPDDSRPIKFVLGGVHRLRVHVVNERHRPLPGIRIRASYVERPNRGGGVRASAIDEFLATADSTGTAEFDAIPIEAISDVYFQSGSVGYHIRDNAALNSAGPLTEVTVVATELPVLRVQVTYPDGRPAPGAQINFTARNYGRGGRITGLSYGQHLYHSPGESAVTVFHGDSYCVLRASTEGFASNMEARVARIGEPLRPVHLVLKPATRVHGTLTVGKDRRRAANESVTLIERDQDNYSKLPEDERLPRTLPLAELAHVAMDLPLHTTTDEQGRFQFDAAPGPYILGAGRVHLNEIVKSKDVKELFPGGGHEFEIKDQKEIAIDLHSDEPVSAIKRSSRSRPATPAKAGS